MLSEKKYISIQDIDAYKIAFNLSNEIWVMVAHWDSFARWSVGQQLVRSADSISANLAEGFGRYHKKEKIHFYRYSYGSMEETKDWIRKSVIRNLIIKEKEISLYQQLDSLPKFINQLIKYTNEKLKY